jgi:hypothetical protein
VIGLRNFPRFFFGNPMKLLDQFNII